MAMNMDAILNLRANVDGANKIVELNRGLMAVEGTAKGVTGAMRGMTGAAAGLSGALGALAPLASVAGLVGLAKGALDAGDRMHDLAQSTGVSVEALARFKKAAAVSGTDIDAVSKALVKLSKTMLDAGTGNKQQAAAFKALGISVTDSNGQLKSADTVMLQIADRFKAMPDGALKTALALKFFGRAGAEMIPLLDMGGAAIDKLSVKMTTAFADKADAYKDKLAVLSGKVGALGADLLIALLPALDKITDAVTAGIDAFNKLPDPVKNFAISGAAVAIAWGPTVSILRGAIGVFAALTTAQVAAGAAAAGATPRVLALRSALGGLLKFGTITVVIDLVVKGLSNLFSTYAEIEKLRNRKAAGGAAFLFAGSTQEEVIKQRAIANQVIQNETKTKNELNSPKSRLLQIANVGGALNAFGGNLPTSSSAYEREQLANARIKSAQSVLSLDPSKFKKATKLTENNFDLSALESGGGEKKKKKAKDRDSQLPEIEAANGLYRSQETIKARIARAEFDQNTAEKLRLEYIGRGVQLLADAAAIQREKIPLVEKEAKLRHVQDQLVASKNEYDRNLYLFQKQAIDSLPSYLSGLESIAAGYSKTLEYAQRLTDEQQKQKGLSEGIAQTIGGGMASAFDALIAGSEGFGDSLRKIASGVLKDIAKQLLQIYVINTAISAISNIFGPKTGGFLPGVKFNASIFSGPSLLNANGNVYGMNGIVPFAQGGIVTRPTMFPFAKGVGLMGEAGPEAIIPLKRGSDGKLGVSGGGTTNVVVNVDAKGSNVQGDNTQGAALGRVISQAVQAELIKQKRPGGLLG